MLQAMLSVAHTSARCVAWSVDSVPQTRGSGGRGPNIIVRLGRHLARGCLLPGLSASTLPATAAERAAFVPLKGQQIRSALRGNSVDGRHWEHRYLPDGRLVRSESGRSNGGGGFKANRLCLLKPEISSTQPVCFLMHQRGNGLQYLDGERLVYQGFLSRSSR